MKVRWGRILLLLVLVTLLCGVGAIAMYYAVVGPSGLSITELPFVGETGGAERPAKRADEPTQARTDREMPQVQPPEVQAPRRGDLEPFNVLTLQYTPYMATLVLMDARGYMEELGYDLQLHDVYGPDIDLDEEGQCLAVQTGTFNALATTLDATRKCGDGVAAAIPIGQSAGNDAIVVKSGVQTWNDVFEHAISFTSLSVSQYMACFASHSANEPMHLPLGYDDASEAVDAWINAGAEQDIQSVVAWEPEVSRALAAVPGSHVILSSNDVRILWDVIEFSTDLVAEDPAPFDAFTRAYYQAQLDLSRDPDGALAAMVAWAEGDEDRQALLTTTDSMEFEADLGNEAFATLRDAAFLMDDRQALLNRLEEAAFYWQYCGVDVPPVADLNSLVLPEFVLAAREDNDLLGGPGAGPGGKVFQVTDFTDASAVTDTQIEQARVLFQTGVDIEFMPNRTDFRKPEAANGVLQNAVRFLRTCQECVLEVQGGAAYPGERVCPGCRPEDSDLLAVDRGRRVYDELRLRFDVPEAQLRFVDQPHQPSFPDSNDESELRQDRRTFLTGYQLSGR